MKWPLNIPSRSSHSAAKTICGCSGRRSIAGRSCRPRHHQRRRSIFHKHAFHRCLLARTPARAENGKRLHAFGGKFIFAKRARLVRILMSYLQLRDLHFTNGVAENRKEFTSKKSKTNKKHGGISTKKMKKVITTIYITLLIGVNFAISQSLGRVGSPTDIVTTTTVGTVLMGGGSDVDAAFTWMINKSGGGDFVVIRATGTNAYNSYIYGLGPAHSVETFLINSTTLANDSAIVKSIRKAEAVFFAGGNQNDYITYYKGTALGMALDYLANVKQVPIGGTSAGMAIQGYVYYDGITNVLSQDVLLNPYASGTGLHYNDFLHNTFLQKTICDTHFNTKGGTTPNGITGRQGRLMSFLSRMIIDSSMTDVKGIACDEKTAVCIDENGIGMVVGINKAYFLRQWCAEPETCITGNPLTWTNGAKIYVINGPGSYTAIPTVAKSVDLKNWTTVMGGTYEYWTVNAGILSIGQTTGTPVTCNITGVADFNDKDKIIIYPNPTNGHFTISLSGDNTTITVTDILGHQILKTQTTQKATNLQLDNNGVYIVYITTKQGTRTRKLIVDR